ncbi:MAG: aminotransferase class V-fold PLP-dependent enzyme [Bacteroidota bacterium]
MKLSDEALTAARALFPYLREGRLYMNHASTSPLSSRVVSALTAYLERRSAGKLETYPQDREMVESLRGIVARLINAESSERIAIQGSTTDAINVVAAGLPWQAGDRVIIGAVEFPANVYPYLNLKQYGVEIDFLRADDGRITPELIFSAVTPRTRLVALSAVQYLSGYRADLDAVGDLCRDRGIVFAVDGIQAVGAVQVDVQRSKIDCLSAGAQKWQMSPHGTGFLYLTEELQSRIRQKHLGWFSVEDPWRFHDHDQALARGARRYEGGSLNMPGLWGMQAALQTIMEFGPSRIESHILAITGELIGQLGGLGGATLVTPEADAERAGIVTISLNKALDAREVFRRLDSEGLTIAVREGKLRYSPHFYNSSDDMRRAAELTKECLTLA